MTPSRELRAIVFLLVAAGATAARAQGGVVDLREELDGDRPEAWAMRWFAAALTPTGFGVAESAEPGRLDLALDTAWIPRLDEEQRRIGFDGTKVEDLNRSPAAGGVRARLSLPARLTVDATWLPPLEVDGARANFVGLGVARPLVEGRAYRFGVRLSAFAGDVRADFTCPASAAAAGPDPPDPETNPYDCEAASRDRLELTVVALELALERAFTRWPAGEAWVMAVVRDVDSTFRVDARYAGLDDRTRLDWSGLDWGLATGVGWQVAERWRLEAELDWTPLDVAVTPVGRGHDVYDPMINVRFGVGYRLLR